MTPPPSTSLIETVTAGYTVDGPVVELGALVVDGAGVPDAKVRLPLASFNRHGLIAGATGTGKTKTLQLLAEQLAAAGVPVFVADMKGDLSGLGAPGEPSAAVAARSADVGAHWQPAAAPVEYFSLGGRGVGTPIRATVTAFGPTLLAKVLDLNDTQSSSLALVFHFADRAGLPLLDLADLRAVLVHLVSDAGRTELEDLGGLSRATAGVILRDLIGFADAGADAFFGEPEFDTADLLRTTADGRGVISCLELPDVAQQPRLFSTFLMWLLADLFQDLPEVGDPAKPSLVFFFDEAHLLFRDAGKAFLEQVGQTVRLIRSKGVGIFFVTQSPKDVPGDVLAQLGNRIQHALRAFTPDDARALRAAASTYPDSTYDLAEVLTQLGTGEAVVTVLSERGAPTPVAWTRMRAPQSLMGPVPAAVLAASVAASPLRERYTALLDRESARELLAARLRPAPGDERDGGKGRVRGDDRDRGGDRDRDSDDPGGDHDQPGVVDRVVGSSAFKSFLRSAGTVLGREITRSVLGTARRPRRR